MQLANEGDTRNKGLIPGVGVPGGANARRSVSFSGKFIPIDGGVWWATGHGVKRIPRPND